MSPFDDMDRMFREMDRTFAQLRSAWLTEFGTPRAGPALESGSGSDSDFDSDHDSALANDVMGRPIAGHDTIATLEDEGDAYVYVMDLPGFEKTDIDLTFDDGLLAIRAHTDVENSVDTHRTVRSRRVSRQIPLRKDIVADEITATYHNGVLEVHLPIVEDDQEDHRHRIDIE
ncbi:Hsp20 family protein [Natronorubrum sp. JWXQ-INN-674]|uniref:Hsp20 family protein n=1 Tax=Natronorubrum halalkaliphilum TaxID=2691917 RepID=A0A6B0VNL0_9EURY|nr:Hsp20/alpha crystallin family protein [Natronorubrum halalkaliphilum]MXV63058.1 Hsp20 family protein [Natronorubrum halalkaliphilum]